MSTEVLHAALRGTIAAAAMSGVRTLTTSLGLVEQPPPDAIAEQGGMLDRIPPERRRAAIELAHWAYGAQGGAAFRLLPVSLREQPWAGPVYGLVLWLGFEVGISPLLGLRRGGRSHKAERAALAADHALYGFVLSEMRRHPQG